MPVERAGKGTLWKADPAAIVAWIRDRDQRRDTKYNLDQERARLASEQADAYAFKNAALRREMVRVADAQRLVGAAISAVRTRLLAIPAGTAPLLVGVTKLSEVRDRLASAIHEALDELSAAAVDTRDGPEGDRRPRGRTR